MRIIQNLKKENHQIQINISFCNFFWRYAHYFWRWKINCVGWFFKKIFSGTKLILSSSRSPRFTTQACWGPRPTSSFNRKVLDLCEILLDLLDIETLTWDWTLQLLGKKSVNCKNSFLDKSQFISSHFTSDWQNSSSRCRINRMDRLQTGYREETQFFNPRSSLLVVGSGSRRQYWLCGRWR